MAGGIQISSTGVTIGASGVVVTDDDAEPCCCGPGCWIIPKHCDTGALHPHYVVSCPESAYVFEDDFECWEVDPAFEQLDAIPDNYVEFVPGTTYANCEACTPSTPSACVPCFQPGDTCDFYWRWDLADTTIDETSCRLARNNLSGHITVPRSSNSSFVRTDPGFATNTPGAVDATITCHGGSNCRWTWSVRVMYTDPADDAVKPLSIESQSMHPGTVFGASGVDISGPCWGSGEPYSYLSGQVIATASGCWDAANNECDEGTPDDDGDCIGGI